MKRLLLAIGTTIVGILVAVAIFEVLARTVLRRPELEPKNLQPAAGVAFASARMLESWYEFGASYRGRPHAQVTIDGITYQHDALGLRQRELEAKQDGEIRILVLGDSNTYGWRTPVEATFVSVCERGLNERFASQQPVRTVRCVNAGLPGYNTDDELRRYRSLRETVQPDIVVLAWMANDAERFGFEVDRDGFLYFDALPVPDHWKPTLTLSYGYRLWSWKSQQRMRTAGEFESTNLENFGFSLGRVETLAAECARHGERFVLVELPVLEPDPGSQRITPSGYTARWTSERLISFAREHSVPFLSFLPAIEGEGVALLWASIDPPDHHPNARAHAKFGAALATFLAERVLAPR